MHHAAREPVDLPRADVAAVVRHGAGQRRSALNRVSSVRGTVKVPTGKMDAGRQHRQGGFRPRPDCQQGSVEDGRSLGFGGYEFRGSPDGIDAPTGAFRWGTGVGFPSRNPLRLSAELNGFMPSSDIATITGTSIVGTD